MNHVAKELLKIAKEMIADGTPFESALKKAIGDKIREEKRDGMVSMSVENMMQVVRPPSSSLDGAPRGTNARYFYSEMFRNICNKEFRSFIKE